ncbi:MAG: hypothetical protein GY879_06615, partial [Planctomycetes bacterium]|nr:hypothetical protein [Planctomycetota bacterium]
MLITAQLLLFAPLPLFQEPVEPVVEEGPSIFDALVADEPQEPQEPQ